VIPATSPSSYNRYLRGAGASRVPGMGFYYEPKAYQVQLNREMDAAPDGDPAHRAPSKGSALHEQCRRRSFSP